MCRKIIILNKFSNLIVKLAAWNLNSNSLEVKMKFKGILMVGLLGVSLVGCNKVNEEQKVGSDLVSPEVVLEDVSENEERVAMYSLEEVGMHGQPQDCWMVIEGQVYDVSEFVKQDLHPGGDEILKGCGIDATELFVDRPGGEGSHSSKARAMLDQYLIGKLDGQ